jgi:hypothetical protein
VIVTFPFFATALSGSKANSVMRMVSARPAAGLSVAVCVAVAEPVAACSPSPLSSPPDDLHHVGRHRRAQSKQQASMR